MRFNNSNLHRLLPRSREGCLLAEWTLTHSDDTGVGSFTYNPNVSGRDETIHLIFEGDCAIDLDEDPRLI